MEINEPVVRDVGGKMRRVGDDAELYIERMAPKMSSSLQRNRGLASLSALERVMEQLQGRARGIAGMSRTMGDNVESAATNHELNEILTLRDFRTLNAPLESDRS